MEGTQKKWPGHTFENDSESREKSSGSSTEELKDTKDEANAVPTVAQTVNAREAEKDHIATRDGKRELQAADCEDELAFAYSPRKKWWILTVIFLVQTSMNFNTSLYSNGLKGISEEFHVSEQAARVGAAAFLVAYAFGCELWAPWSEEFGRKPVLQLSLFFTNIFTIPVALAPNFGTIVVARTLGGLSTAGGSVTLGMVADLYDSDNQQLAVAYIVFSSVGGSILGPIIGGFVETLAPNVAWRWCTWIQLIFGASVQLLHIFTVPETRTTIMMDRVAKKRRSTGVDPNIWGPGEIYPFRERFTFKELMHTWSRPFRMFLTEPIVLSLSLLSGFSDALIFMQIQSLGLVYKQWNFNSWQIGLSFIPFALGYTIAWLIFIPSFRRNRLKRERNPHDEHAQYESRLYLLLWLAPCLPIGLIIFAWTSMGPPLHWIGTMFGTTIIGIANYAIYMATIDYMICAYGPYSASATGGNGWARDILAGILTVPATPFYLNIGKEKGTNLQYASTILFAISAVLVTAIYAVYYWGPTLRKRSPFAQDLASGAANAETRHAPTAGRAVSALDGHRDHDPEAMAVLAEKSVSTPPLAIIEHREEVSEQSSAARIGFGPTSPRSSYIASVQAASRRHSREASREGSKPPSANASRRNSLEQAHIAAGDFTGDQLHSRLANLGTIMSEQTESHSS
ncbi:MFS general substrate transporter [Xylariaceae sp. FL0594]|nr:MFS general substrate transporter [Xylariaceae sp. FL0594]